VLDGPFALALTAGMAATVNPCGFAMLPAYLSAFLGVEQRPTGADAVFRALSVSAAMIGGFVAVFGLFGLIITPLALSIDEYLPWVTIVVGIALVALGIAFLAGRHPTLRLPALQRGGGDGSLVSMFLFGVSYATASLSCTIGPFLAVTSTTFRSSNLVSGVSVFVVYALGMGIVIAVLTVALAVAKQSLVHRLRAIGPRLDRIAGVLILIAGLYVAYYGWYERQVLAGGDGEDPIIDRAVRIQAWLTNAVVPDNPTQVGVVAAIVLIAVGGWAVTRRRRSPE
jgi:cytochrome c biogenesis protein CcdA